MSILLLCSCYDLFFNFFIKRAVELFTKGEPVGVCSFYFFFKKDISGTVKKIVLIMQKPMNYGSEKSFQFYLTMEYNHNICGFFLHIMHIYFIRTSMKLFFYLFFSFVAKIKKLYLKYSL